MPRSLVDICFDKGIHKRVSSISRLSRKEMLHVVFDDSVAEPGQRGDEMFEVVKAPSRYDMILSTKVEALGYKKRRREVHRDGDWHESVEVWLVSEAEHTVLVQQRSSSKDTNPNRLDASCAGHVDSEDLSPRDTAVRELHEELGLQCQPHDLVPAFLSPCITKGCASEPYLDRELVHVFILTCDSFQDIRFTVAANEVANLHLESIPTVLNNLGQGSERYVPKPPHYVHALAQVLHRKEDELLR